MEDVADAILVTGGAGYIGSHVIRELTAAGFQTVALDNLSQGHREAVSGGELVEGDLGDEELLDRVLEEYSVSGVMHFAAQCSVPYSVRNPQLYYEENVGKSLVLFRSMLKAGVRRLIFSSTCATYGNPVRIPIDEDHPQCPINPYGETKYFVERILREYDRAHGLRYVSLRYFNAAGASRDGLLGESHEPETHLIPKLLQASCDPARKFLLFGEDYDTPDGSCIRDYVHVLDLADAHVAAYGWLRDGGESQVFNLGTGRGFSVKEVLEESRRVTGVDIPVQVARRRAGDPAELVADPAKANRLLGWACRHSELPAIVGTAWNWERARTF